MKKLLLLYALLIFACGSDDSSNNDSIEGIWYLVSSTETSSEGLISCGSYLEITMNNFSETLCDGYPPINDGNPISENFEGSLIYYRALEEMDCTPIEYKRIYINENSNNYDFYWILATIFNECDFENRVATILNAVINGNTLTLYSIGENGEDIVEVFEKN
jgi:hypothetical protein